MPLDPDIFRQAMRSWTTGVTIVTSVHENVQARYDRQFFHFCIGNPPQILIAISHNTRTHHLITRSQDFWRNHPCQRTR
jgi:flavin reductase (DIM6/NTAB) family NADH-FMN oxidoreductase RutF